MEPLPLRTTIRGCGLLSWCGICAYSIASADSWVRVEWWTPFALTFIVAFVWSMSAGRASRWLLALQAAAVTGMVAVLCQGYEGFLLVLIAAQLPAVTSLRAGLIWLAAQSTAVTLGIAYHWSPRAALMLVPPYVGFQVLAFLAIKNYVQLLSLRVDLAERGREQERIKIAHELHDSLGHQLVALGLGLELAKNRSDGEVRKLVETAQTLSRQTLSDVKNLVHLMAQERPVNLRLALQQLAQELPEPQVHIDWQRSVASECAPENALLLRIVQEIVANSIQHARSRNIWIHAVDHPAETELWVQDDGRGMENAGRGMGLSGIRTRVAALGGTLHLKNLNPCGFEVRVSIPRAQQVAS